jgi:hypothetical protein
VEEDIDDAFFETGGAMDDTELAAPSAPLDSVPPAWPHTLKKTGRKNGNWASGGLIGVRMKRIFLEDLNIF